MQSDKPRRNKPHPKLVKRANTAYWNIRYYDENGKRKFHSTTTTDEKIALGELADFIKLEEQGRLSVAPSVQEAVDFYVSVKKQAGLPANILKTPKVIEYFKDVPANIISKEMCREYIAWRTAQFSVVRKNEKIKSKKNRKNVKRKRFFFYFEHAPAARAGAGKFHRAPGRGVVIPSG